jgi:multiple sugar transport system substrate-binding protein
MNKNNTKKQIAGIAAFTLVFISACSGGAPEAKKEPEKAAAAVNVSDAKLPAAELFILSKVPSITQDEFERTMAAPIQAKYPHYKLTYLIESGNNNLNNLLVAGKAPDIMITSIANLYSSMIPNNLQYDLSPLIKKYNYNMARIEPSTIESLKNATSEGGIYGLPKYLNTVVTFYNKDIFKRFGVPFPKDGMTWDEMTALAKTMTRSVDGINYRGMGFFYSNMIVENQLSLPFFNAKEDKSAVNTPGFQKMFQTYKAIYDIPGNKPEGKFTADSELTAFQKNRNIAMVMAPMSGYGRFEADKDLDWDLVSAPTYTDVPSVGYQANTIYYFVSDANKKAEQAFQVVTHLLSDDIQQQANKEARPTILSDKNIRTTLGTEHKLFKDKNFKAVFYNKFAPTPVTNSKVATNVNGANLLATEFVNMIQEGTDVNTMLRQADEKINQAITAAQKK